MVDPIGQPCFHFIKMSVVGLAVGLDGVDGLAIGESILTGVDVAVNFFK